MVGCLVCGVECGEEGVPETARVVVRVYIGGRQERRQWSGGSEDISDHPSPVTEIKPLYIKPVQN